MNPVVPDPAGRRSPHRSATRAAARPATRSAARPAIRPRAGSPIEPCVSPDGRDLNRLRRHLLNRAFQALGDPNDAEDACQEALTRTWQALRAKPCDPSRFAAYSFGVLRNVLHENWRTARREGRVVLGPPDDEPDPLTRLLQGQARATMGQALDELPDEQRAALTLTVVEGLSSAAAGRRTGLRPATIRQQKRRGLRRLRDLLTAGPGESVGVPSPGKAAWSGAPPR
jgi:RNA polymerase sigma-70 factor, ECF subfamily